MPAASQTGRAGPPAIRPCTWIATVWTGRPFGRGDPLDWRGAALSCAGNARPDGKGLRLFFAGRPADGEDGLLLVLGIAADVSALPGREHTVSVTLIDEASDQFFHSPADRCFTRIREVKRLPAGGALAGGRRTLCGASVVAEGSPPPGRHAISAVYGERLTSVSTGLAAFALASLS